MAEPDRRGDAVHRLSFHATMCGPRSGFAGSCRANCSELTALVAQSHRLSITRRQCILRLRGRNEHRGADELPARAHGFGGFRGRPESRHAHHEAASAQPWLPSHARDRPEPRSILMSIASESTRTSRARTPQYPAGPARGRGSASSAIRFRNASHALGRQAGTFEVSHGRSARRSELTLTGSAH